ncbi:serine hydrolase [Streptomyces cirratus]
MGPAAAQPPRRGNPFSGTLTPCVPSTHSPPPRRPPSSPQRPPPPRPASTTTPAPPPHRRRRRDGRGPPRRHRHRHDVPHPASPGVSVAVVHNDKVIHLKGFGVRKTGEPATVGPDTRLPGRLPLQAHLLHRRRRCPQGPAQWDDHVPLPGFALKDPWVTDHVTTADLFSHRSGLPDHAGDLLEDLGYDRTYILDHLRLEPLTPFRASYAYTNFGLTAAAEAIARAHGVSCRSSPTTPSSSPPA